MQILFDLYVPYLQFSQIAETKWMILNDKCKLFFLNQYYYNIKKSIYFAYKIQSLI